MTDYSRYPQPAEVYKNWIESIMNEAQDKLTSWELDFIASISSRYSNLSQKQAQILERIYSEKT